MTIIFSKLIYFMAVASFCHAQNAFILEKGFGHINSGYTIDEIIRDNYKYPFEFHYVTTSDGYILELHRISYIPINDSNLGNRPVALLAHGITSDSMLWVAAGKEYSFPIILADHGYDVWMMNQRGSRYSSHVTWDTHSPMFYNYSLDDAAAYDFPPILDYIEQKTGQQKVCYVGYSQSVLTGFAFAARFPEHNHRFHIMAMFGPVWYIDNISAPLYTTAKQFKDFIASVLSAMHGEVVLVPDHLRNALINLSIRNSVMRELLHIMTGLMFGRNPTNSEHEWVSMLIQSWLYPVSQKNLWQVFCIIRDNHFHYFDYGVNGNLIAYGTPTAPDYNLSKIETPVALFIGNNDFLVNRKDVEKLSKDLAPSLVEIYTAPDKMFSHLDFAASKNAKDTVYKRALELFDEYRQKDKSQ